MLLFLDFGINCTDLPEPRTQLHNSILHTLMQGGKLLDVGCMFGQDLRKLVYEGAPVSSVYGTDVRGDYFSLGYALFKDESIIPSDHFIAADIIDPDSPLRCFDRELDVIFAKDVFHCFDYPKQIELAMRFVALLKSRPGSRVVGQLVGHIERWKIELRWEALFAQGVRARATSLIWLACLRPPNRKFSIADL